SPPTHIIACSASLSGERRLGVRETLLHFFDRSALPLVLVFNIGADRPLLALQQLQDLPDRRLALAPRRVVALVLLAILQMQVRDVGMMLTDVRDRIEVRRREMPDVEVHLEV